MGLFNSKQELIKRAAEIAKKKHPAGFNKKDLILASEEVFDGYGVAQLNTIRKPVKTMEDVSNMGNAMAHIDGRYPVGMDGCHVVGINGGCGRDCPVYLEGDCEEYEEFASEFENDEQERQYIELYGAGE